MSLTSERQICQERSWREEWVKSLYVFGGGGQWTHGTSNAIEPWATLQLSFYWASDGSLANKSTEIMCSQEKQESAKYDNAISKVLFTLAVSELGCTWPLFLLSVDKYSVRTKKLPWHPGQHAGLPFVSQHLSQEKGHSNLETSHALDMVSKGNLVKKNCLTLRKNRPHTLSLLTQLT